MKTEMTDSELRRAHDALLRSRRPASGESAVPLDRILALVEQRGSEEERLATLDAVMADAASTREFELLRALAANRLRAQTFWRVPARVVSLAAAAAVIFVAVLVAKNGTAPRGDDPLRAVDQSAVLVDPPVQASPTQSRTFRWHAVAGARMYSMEILTAAGTPMFTTRVSDTTVTLPADVPITAGVEYRWWVATEFNDGTQRRSGFRRLIVRDTR